MDRSHDALTHEHPLIFFQLQTLLHMLDIHHFTFNAYQENTYLITDTESRETLVVDPGCYSSQERGQLQDYIEHHQFTVRKLINTHGHIDHMLGNHFVKQTYKVPFLAHKLIEAELKATQSYGAMFGLNPDMSPMPDQYLEEGDVVEVGEHKLEVLFTPGHSPSHLSFFHRESKQLVSGDVLFKGSIGRVDLPGGSYPVLMKSIVDKLLPLGDDVTVFNGHGLATTIGEEKATNPFILDWQRQQRG